MLTKIINCCSSDKHGAMYKNIVKRNQSSNFILFHLVWTFAMQHSPITNGFPLDLLPPALTNEIWRRTIVTASVVE